MRRGNRERELSSELESHLEMHIADNLRAGMTPDEARRQAVIALGGVEQTRERALDAFRFSWLDSLLKDVQFGVRTIRRSTGFTALVIITLAVGIAATNTAFTIVNAVMIRELPFDEAHRLVDLGIAERDGMSSLSYADLQDWRTSSRTFEGLAGFQTGSVNVADDTIAAERFLGSWISANTFSLLRVRPAIGRDFVPDDDKAGMAPVVILSDRLWRRRYAADRGILGRTIRVDAQPVTVIGIMPAQMEFPLNTALWQPLGNRRGIAGQPRDERNLAVFGRLAPRITDADALAELNRIVADLANTYPATNRDTRPVISRFRPGIGGPLFIIFGAFMSAVGLLLLVSCANVANLLLSRSFQRSREMSVRAAVGATRWRLVRQLLVESAMLAGAAGVGALALSSAAMRLFRKYASEIDTPFWMDFSMDASVFVFLSIVCLGTSIVFGLAPALHLSRAGANEVLKEAAGRTGTAGISTRRWSTALIVCEVMITVVLVTSAVAMMRHLIAELSVKGQIDTAHLLTMTLRLPAQTYPTREERSSFYRRLDERLARPTNVGSVAVANVAPTVGGGRRQLSLDGSPPAAGQQLPSVNVSIVGARYFDTAGLRVVRGRPLGDDDAAAGREGVVVDQLFVDRFLRRRDPIGTAVTLIASHTAPQRAAIVGVAEALHNPTDEDPVPVVYLPYLIEPVPSIVLLAQLRSAADIDTVASTLRQDVRAVDPDLPLFEVRTLEDLLHWRLWVNRVFGGMFAIFAGIAVLIATAGIYGVVAYAMSQRTREIGIRMALGARKPQLWWAMMRAKIAQISLGVIVGAVVAVQLLRLMGGLLVGRYGQDPLTLAISAGFLLVLGVLAMLWPIWRATSRSPVAALRYQ